jgi:hypothetical protein
VLDSRSHEYEVSSLELISAAIVKENAPASAPSNYISTPGYAGLDYSRVS